MPGCVRTRRVRALIVLLMFSGCAHRVTLTVHQDGRVEGRGVDVKYPVHGEQVWAGYATKKWLPEVRFDSAERTTLRLKLEVPDGWTSAGTFDVSEPTPPFLFAWAAGRFTRTELEADGHVFVALNGNQEVLLKTAAMARFLRERTGLELPVRTYTQVFVHGEAAQEAVGVALIGEAALNDADAEWVFIHELAHQWFGVSLKCLDFDDFWLNEGFATFFVGAWLEQLHGRDAYEAEVARWKSRAEKVQGALSLAPPGLPRPHTPDSKLQPRGITYSKGALFLHSLRRELGEATFWSVMRNYVTTNVGRDVTSGDFRLALEKVTGRSWTEDFAKRVYSP